MHIGSTLDLNCVLKLDTPSFTDDWPWWLDFGWTSQRPIDRRNMRLGRVGSTGSGSWLDTVRSVLTRSEHCARLNWNTDLTWLLGKRRRQSEEASLINKLTAFYLDYVDPIWVPRYRRHYRNYCHLTTWSSSVHISLLRLKIWILFSSTLLKHSVLSLCVCMYVCVSMWSGYYRGDIFDKKKGN